MAEVYLAQEQGAQNSIKYVAIKKILSAYSTHFEYKQMFIDEGIIGCQLHHNNICQVSPLLELPPNFYIPMEYISGKNFLQVIQRHKKFNEHNPLPLPMVLFVITEVLKGLDYAHNKLDERDGKPLHIVHRDMSPQNIMLSFSGDVKIIDFGIVKTKITSNETRAGVIKGKYTYLSPEQALGDPVDCQSDVFSIGIVLWESITGMRLFQRDSELKTLRAIQECNLKDWEPVQRNHTIPNEINQIIMKSLAKDKSMRFKTAEAMCLPLQKYLNEHYSGYSSKDLRVFLEQYFSDDIRAEREGFKEPTATENFLPSVASSAPRNASIDKPSGIETKTKVSIPGGLQHNEHLKTQLFNLQEPQYSSDSSKAILATLVLTVAISLITYFYKPKSKASFPIKNEILRSVTSDGSENGPIPIKQSGPYECTIEVETNPSGALLSGVNFTGTSSNGTLRAPCDKKVVIRIEKPKFLPVTLPVWVLKKKIFVPEIRLQHLD